MVLAISPGGRPVHIAVKKQATGTINDGYIASGPLYQVYLYGAYR